MRCMQKIADEALPKTTSQTAKVERLNSQRDTMRKRKDQCYSNCISQTKND